MDPKRLRQHWLSAVMQAVKQEKILQKSERKLEGKSSSKQANCQPQSEGLMKLPSHRLWLHSHTFFCWWRLSAPRRATHLSLDWLVQVPHFRIDSNSPLRFSFLLHCCVQTPRWRMSAVGGHPSQSNQWTTNKIHKNWLKHSSVWRGPGSCWSVSVVLAVYWDWTLQLEYSQNLVKASPSQKEKHLTGCCFE